jgi:DNA-binding MarR family transcriptional regulator
MPAMPILKELKQTRPFASPAQEAMVALLRTADVVNRLIDSAIERQGITGQQYNVLRILRGAGEKGLPTLEIAERMIEQTPGITRLIDRLEAKKLVIRERCATDRRQVFCRISAAGLSLLAKLDEPVRAVADEALHQLSKKDIAQLLELLDRTRESTNAAMLKMEENQ